MCSAELLVAIMCSAELFVAIMCSAELLVAIMCSAELFVAIMCSAELALLSKVHYTQSVLLHQVFENLGHNYFGSECLEMLKGGI